MAVLTQGRMRSETRIKKYALPLGIGNKAFANGVACADLVAGVVRQGIPNNHTLLKIGEFEDTYDNTGGAATVPILVDLDDELVLRYYDNDGTIVAANLFALCYILDDHTVSLTATGNSIAGRIWDVDSVKGVAVQPVDTIGGRTLPIVPAATLGAFVAGSLTVPVAAIQLDAVFDVPATAATSVIVLPTAAPDGSRIMFCADGVKNNQTVQYQDQAGSTNLTTALTLSKRHQVTCVKENGKWFANAYVSP